MTAVAKGDKGLAPWGTRLRRGKNGAPSDSFQVGGAGPELRNLGKLGCVWRVKESKQPPMTGGLSLPVMKESWVEAKTPGGDPPA